VEMGYLHPGETVSIGHFQSLILIEDHQQRSSLADVYLLILNLVSYMWSIKLVSLKSKWIELNIAMKDCAWNM
jgi:hypothetical protein